MNKVTIVIPVYNSEKYIAKCLESVLNQTYKDFEILVINDGSKDNSKKIIDEYAEKYPEKIKAIHQENKGVSITRNNAIKMVKTEYIMFMDNDDFIDKDYIEVLVENIEKEKYDVVISGYRRPNENGKILKTMKLENEEWSKMMILAPWAKIYRTNYLVENNIEFLNNNIGEDVYFNLQAMLISNKIKIIDYVGYNWFFNTKSVSNTIQKDITKIEVFKLLNECYNVLKEKGLLEKKYELIEMHFIRYIIWFISFSTKRIDKKIIDDYYDKLFNWLQERFPNYKHNKLIGIRKPKGEILGIRLLYLIFMIAHKMKLGKLLVFVYSKI